MKWISVCLGLCILHVCAFSAAQEPVTPEEFLAQEDLEQSATFEVVAEQIQPAQMLELIYKCTQPAAEAAGDHLAIRGFSIVDARDYRVRGPMALGSALTKAELEAKANAAEALSAVSIAASETLESSETTASADSETSSGENQVVLQSFSVESIETLKQTRSSGVEAVLQGGRVTKSGIISLGDQGLCVVVRYEVPLDQSNYDPSADLLPESESGTAETVNEDESTEGGYEAPPAGSIGDF